MKRCETCSYTPKEEPKIFCPACGAMWERAAEPKPERKTKVPIPPKAKPKPKKAAAKKSVTKPKKGN